MTPKNYLDLGIELLKRGDREDAVTAFCLAIKLDSKYVPAYNNLGLVLKDTDRSQEAAACFYRVLELDPDNSYAYNNLGLLWMDAGDREQAAACFRRSIALDPEQAAVYNNLGTVLEEQYCLVEAEAAYRRAVELRPNYPEAQYNLGRFLKVLQRLEEAIPYLQRAVALRPGYMEAGYSLASLYLQQGQFTKGWGLYEQSRRRRYGSRYFSAPHWQGEALAGRRILLYWEYGFGDTLQFVRYVACIEALKAKVDLWVQPPLAALLENTYPGLVIHSDAVAPAESYDYVCSLMSLPVILETCLESIPPARPYVLHSSGVAASAWRELLGTMAGCGYKVGLVWAGNPKHKNDDNRSISFSLLSPLLAVQGINWVSLQVGPRASDLAEICCPVLDVADRQGNFLDTARLVEQLDLVITVDTSVAHLAGSLGKETWLLLAFDADWRWLLAREDSPWYPSVKLFRQREPGDWPEVVARVKTALELLPRAVTQAGQYVSER
ncbi:tetratricopeptide repeat protein [Propionispora hippei]|uniref:Tetratricopeptide (TPR) repeat n=1 Tax=Propionispora hippei DSM 15287 TaxID=1123003 RepID=A0A1M6NRJ9_9FIRM|nr:tetratricopeptide repeat protein [Propionispora hippei]SHJ98256.1 Tetratricopeptide (TPR) repeat [Propionispora hippei DSM 15287]